MRVRLLYISLIFVIKSWGQIPDSSEFIHENESEYIQELKNISNYSIKDPARAEIAYKNLSDRCIKWHFYGFNAIVLRHLAGFYFNQGKINQAQDNILKAIAYCDKNDLKAELYIQSGNIEMAQGRLTEATANYFKALKLATLTNNREAEINAYTALGNIYFRQNNFSQSLEYQTKALQLYEHTKNKFKTLSMSENIGQLYMRMQQYHPAEQYFIKSLGIYREINNEAGQAAALQNLGICFSKQKKYDVAISTFEKAIQIVKKLKINPIEISILNNLAEAEFNAGYLEVAGKHYRESATKAKLYGLDMELNTAYEGLNLIYKKANEQSKALTYQILSREMKDSIFNDSALKTMSNMQLQYETEMKQHQIALLEKDANLHNLQLDQEKKIKWGLISLASILFLGIILVIFLYIRNRQTAQKLAIQNSEMRVQKDKLRQLNSVKDRFFSIISHDLRNNLASMKLYFELQARKNKSDESDKKIQQEIASSVNNTIDLLENLLVWANEQIQGRAIRKEKIRIKPMVEEIMGFVQAGASPKNIQLSNLVDDDCYAIGDPDMISLIMRNLISNAVKFTKLNGEVSVNQYQADGKLYISVIDNGIGISANNINQLFTRFENTSTKGTGNEKGTGLGLLLCKEYAEKNGGEIRVESEAGKGSCFTLVLPESIS